jgi:hypothetical protein
MSRRVTLAGFGSQPDPRLSVIVRLRLLALEDVDPGGRTARTLFDLLGRHAPIGRSI